MCGASLATTPGNGGVVTSPDSDLVSPVSLGPMCRRVASVIIIPIVAEGELRLFFFFVRRTDWKMHVGAELCITMDEIFMYSFSKQHHSVGNKKNVNIY